MLMMSLCLSIWFEKQRAIHVQSTCPKGFATILSFLCLRKASSGRTSSLPLGAVMTERRGEGNMLYQMRMYCAICKWRIWYWLVEQRWAPEWMICWFDQDTETLNELDRWEYGEDNGSD
jgi:hypothetical protein